MSAKKFRIGSPIQKERERNHTKIAIHTVTQFYGDNKQLSLFSDEKIDAFKDATGLNLTNRPANYGVVLNQAQRKVFEGVLKAFTYTNYKGDEQKDISPALREVYSNTETSAKTLVKGDNAPYKNIDAIPVLKLTQAQIIELSGHTRSQGDKQDVIEALSFLATNQFCFYWLRSQKINKIHENQKKSKNHKNHRKSINLVTLYKLTLQCILLTT
jgi:hypothetical protein